MGRQAEGTCSKAVDHASKSGLAEQETKDSKPLAVYTVGMMKVGKPPSLTGEFVGKWG